MVNVRYLWLSFALALLACGSSFSADPFPDLGGAAGAIGTGSDGGRTSISFTGGTGGASGTAGAASTAGVGGEPATGGVGGAASGGTSSGGSATGGSSTGGVSTGGMPTGGTGGVTCAVDDAVLAALPDQFSWQSYSASQVTGAGPACSACKTNPCGGVPVTWSRPVLSGLQAFVPMTATTCVAGVYGSCPATSNCSLCVTAQNVLVTLTLQHNGTDYLVQSVSVSGGWTVSGTCSYTSADAAATALNSSLTAALKSLPILCR